MIKPPFVGMQDFFAAGLEKLEPFLPVSGPIGFFSDCDPDKALLYFSTYTLAPRLLVREEKSDSIVAIFADANHLKSFSGQGYQLTAYGTDAGQRLFLAVLKKESSR